jgi:hypothetical protein
MTMRNERWAKLLSLVSFPAGGAFLLHCPPSLLFLKLHPHLYKFRLWPVDVCKFLAYISWYERDRCHDQDHANH